MLAVLIVIGSLTGIAQDWPPNAPPAVHPMVWQLLQQDLEPVPVWVFLTDKALPARQRQDQAALQRRAADLTPRALERRRLRRTWPGLVDERDLPLNPEYVTQIAGVGAKIRAHSRWLNAISVSASAAQIRALAALPCVRAIEPVRRGRIAEAVPILSPQPAERPERQAQGMFYGLSQEQLSQIRVTDMHAAGYTGEGIVIGVLDTGFSLTHEAYNELGHPIDVIDQYDFINDDPNPGIEPEDAPNQHYHGTLVLGTIAAYKPTVLVGGAYNASFILAKTEDTTDEYLMEEDFYVAGLEFVEAGGADLATSSLGYYDWYEWFDMDGLTAVTSVAVNIATANGMACCTAVGNRGADGDLPSLIAPSDAFDVLACGAVDASGTTADFSSNGPSADGRVKPEVLARGVSTSSLDPYDDSGYSTANGTSLSTPLVASAVALLIQAHPTWTIEQLRTALFETADDFVANGIPDPESRRGYGVINVHAASEMNFCPADLNEDGEIGSPDLAQLLGDWGFCLACASDLNSSGVVDAADLAQLLAGWGPCD